MTNKKIFYYITTLLLLLCVLIFILHEGLFNYLSLDTLHYLIIDDIYKINILSFNPNNFDIIQYISNPIESNNNNDCSNCYNNFISGVKSRLFWLGWERYKDKYNSFEEFRKTLDPNTKMHKIIKNDIKNEFEGLTRAKNVISWLLSRKNPSKAREYKRPKIFTPAFTDIAKVLKK